MNLTLEWSIQTKEEFMEFLIRETHERFKETKKKRKITDEECQDVLDDLRTMAKHFLK